MDEERDQEREMVGGGDGDRDGDEGLGGGVGGGGAGAGDDEMSLPRATVYKLISEMLPTGVTCPKETRDLLIECCVEFIHLVSSEANEVCERNNRKTIGPDHVLEALKTLGFSAYIEEALQAYEEAQSQAKEKERARGANKLEKSGLTEEELQRQQEELFEQARRKYLENQQRSNQNSPSPQSLDAVAE